MSDAAPLTARIEVFRPGTFTPMGGRPITFSAADLRAIADAYDPETAPAPVVVGHPETDAPAFGWAKGFEYDSDAERLVAVVHEIEPAFAELVKAGRLKKVSMKYFAPSQAHNPVPGTWYPKHIGFLGAAAPAVPGLKNVQFDGPDGVVFEASFGAAEETSSLLRSLPDFLIEKFGLEAADKALPSWRIEWLDEQDRTAPAYAAGDVSPAPEPNPEPEEKESAVTQPDPAFAAREADIAAREKAIADREAAAAHTENAAFAEKLVADGRLIPASRDKVVALLDALPADEAVSFSEGSAKLTAAAALREVLEAQPKVVQFGSLDLPEDVSGARAVAFSADGKAVDPAGLELHQKALAWQRANPGIEYLGAVQAVS